MFKDYFFAILGRGPEGLSDWEKLARLTPKLGNLYVIFGINKLKKN